MLVVKNPSASAGDARDIGSTPGSGRSLGKGNGTHSSVRARKSHRQRNLAGYSPCGCKAADMTERLSTDT